MNTESSQSHPGDIQGQPSPPAQDPSPPTPRTGRLGRFLRWLLILLILIPTMGYLAAVFAGKTVPFWTLPLPHWGSPDPALSDLLGSWHAVLALALTGVILLYLALRLWAALRRPTSSRKPSAKTPPRPSTPASARIPAHVTPVKEGPVPHPAPAPAEPGPARPSLRRRGLAAQLQIFGSVAFWVQVCLGLVAILLLMVTASSNYYSQNQLKLPSELSWAKGVVWAHLAAVVLVATIVGFHSCTRLARGLRLGIDPVGAPQRARRLSAGLTFGCSLGLTLAILGTAFSIALLIAKTISQPPGIAITDPQTIVRAVDVFVLLANFMIVVAHFIGILISLWILNQIQHLGRTSPVRP